MSNTQEQGRQGMLADRSVGAITKYRLMVVGEGGIGTFLKYEFIIWMFSGWSGALGLWLRQIFFSRLCKKCGRNVVFGRNVTLRHPGRICIGDNVVIGDDCTLDGKGTTGEGIIIGDGVFLGKGTVITMIEGTLEIDDGANIGSYCRIGTFGNTRIGKKALLAAFVYVVGAGHRAERIDIPILDQGRYTKGGSTVGDGSWLGTKVSVMDGVHIGRDCIVGAHAVVTEDLPDFAVAVGIPAKVVKMRNE